MVDAEVRDDAMDLVYALVGAGNRGLGTGGDGVADR
jgi:hypothetical protein